MCIGAIIRVKCKHCLAKGLSRMELLECEICDSPCERSSTLLAWHEDTVAEREYCEICTSDFDQESESDQGCEKLIRVTRFDCDPDAETRPLDWREQGMYLASTEYGFTQGGVSVECPDSDEDLSTLEEQITALFRDFGKQFSTHGKPEVDFTCKETESGELVSPKVQWPSLALCEEAEEGWMLIQSEIQTCA